MKLGCMELSFSKSWSNLSVFNTKSKAVCHACQFGRSHILPFHLSLSVSNGRPLDLLFTDVWVLPFHFTTVPCFY